MMCRCNANIRSPYCHNCGTLISRKGLKTSSFCEILAEAWRENIPQENALSLVRSSGFIASESDVEVAYMMLDYLWRRDNNYE